MAFREYGNYDGIGLADLVRKKQVSAAELLDEAIARTAKVDPADQRGGREALRLRPAANRQGLPDGPFTGVPFLLKDLDLLEGTRTTFGASIFKDNVADHTGTLAQRFLDSGRHDLRQKRQSGIRIDADHGVAAVRPDPQSLESGAFLRRFFRRRGGCGRRAHSSRGACQRRRRFDPHSRLRIRRVRIETDPRAQSARPRSRRRLGRIFLRSCREHQRARQRGDAGCDSRARNHRAPMSRRRRSGLLPRKSAAIPADCASPLPTSRLMATPSIPKSRRRFGKSPALLAGLGHHVEERAPALAADPAAVMATIVGRQYRAERAACRTAARPRNDRQRFRDIDAGERPQRAKGKRDRLCRRATRRLPDFARPRRASSRPATCSCARRFARHRCASARSTRCRTICRISRRSCGVTCPATAMFNMSGQPAMSVPLAWNAAGLPLGMMFAARFGDEATLFRLAAQLEQERPWKENCRRFAHKPTKLSRIRVTRKEAGARSCRVPLRLRHVRRLKS